MEQIIRQCKNSSGKIIGEVEILENKIIIRHYIKPELIITDVLVIQEIKNKTIQGIKILYDEYFLTTAEIAALYNLPYSTMNREKIPKAGVVTGKNAGRRNSRYGATFSEETKRKIGEASKGRKNSGNYVRTPEIREKISQGLKNYYATHEISEEPRKKLSQAWVEGKYKNTAMGTGIHGYFTSFKNNKTFYFRSLLELKYLILLEENKEVNKYQIEPFQIPLKDKIHHYTPDFLINETEIKELKTSKHLSYTKEDERFAEETAAALKYANENNMTFEVIYDTDLGFETRQFKRWLLAHPETINLYSITFDRDISKWS